MLLDRKAAQRVVDQTLAETKTLKGAEVEVTLTVIRAANTRFARSEITSTGDSEDTALDIDVAYGKRHASVTVNQLAPTSLREAVARAGALARIAPEDPEQMPLLPPQTEPVSAPRWDNATAALDTGARARAAGQAIAAGRERGVDVAGFFSHHASMTILGNSAGLRTALQSTEAALSMTARTTDGAGSGWAGLQSIKAGELDAAALAHTAIEKAVRSQKPRQLQPGKYQVVLEPAAVGELLAFLIGALGARQADEGRSFFAKPGGGSKIGDKIFGESVRLTSSPADPLAPADPHDGDGMPVAPTAWIENGVLKNLHYTRYWAAKQGKTAMGHPSRFHLHGGRAASIDELVKGIDRGVLVTRFWYIRSLDPQTVLCTGLTRDGVFLVEKGEIVGPVNNFRFNESPVKMLANVEAMTEATWRTPASASLRVPAIRTAEFNLASTSEAV